PPMAHDDSFFTNEDTALTTGNVLGTDPNAAGYDTDDDTIHSRLKAVKVSGPSHALTFTLNSDGSFSYVPLPDFESAPADSFTYKVNDGLWTDGLTPLSPDSNTATVTISVVSRHTVTSVSSSKNPSVYGDTVIFTATVTPVSPQLGTPIGTVKFMDGATQLGTGNLAPGVGFSTATFDTSSLPALLNAGAHTITAVYCGNTTTFCSPDTVFYGSTSAPLNQVINPAHLTVTADNKNRVYGDPNPPFTATITGFVGGQTLPTSGVTGTATCSSTATPTTNAGTYGPATPEAITCAVGSLTAANYDFTPFVNGALTITKAHLTVTADNAARTFGAANPAFTATLSGFKNGEILATSGVTGAASCTSIATASTNAGTYGPATPEAITCTVGSLAAGNYDFTTFVNGTLTINPAPSATTFGPAPAATFPGANFTVHASNNSGGVITYSYVSGPCALVDASAGTFSTSGVGSCVVQADSAATVNYLASMAQQTVTISAP
ncbi:MAG TPA: MBG domain-containing protein, partial [Vicinamibacterales bacterium]|nr:MBG domain-containing protein [Vicinamibacterales bacterium]